MTETLPPGRVSVIGALRFHGFQRHKVVLAALFVMERVFLGGVVVHQALQGVGVVVVALVHADQTGRDVGAVVGDALHIVQHIQEDDAGVDGADAVLQALDVLVAQLFDHDVNDLFQRLHLTGQCDVIVLKGVVRQVQHALHRAGEELELLLCVVAEGRFLLIKLLGFFHDVDGIVADALVLGDEVQQLGHSMALVVAQLLVGHLDEVVGDLDLHPVDEVFPDVHRTHDVFVHLEQQRSRQVHVAGSTAGHLDHRVLGLLQGNGRALEQALVQHGHTELLRFLGAVGHGEDSQLRQHTAERQEEEHRRHAGHGVDVCDGALVHHIAPDRDADGVAHRIDGRQQHHAADDIKIKVDQCGALAILGGAADGQQRGEGRADVGTQNDGDGRAEGDKAGAGQCLQDTDRCRGRLDDDRDHHAHENAEDGVGHADEQVLERRALPQGRNAGIHQVHAGEQDAEAQHDLADVLFLGVAQEHIKNAANKRDHRCEGLGLHQGQPQAVAGDIRHADELAGDSRTNVRTHDHAYRLREGHDPGVDKADTDDDRARRRLDDAGDEGAENDALDGGRGQLLQYALHLAARQLLQAGAHDRHAVQEQRNTAQQRGDVCDIHLDTPKNVLPFSFEQTKDGRRALSA